jgi:hypothetical protein
MNRQTASEQEECGHGNRNAQGQHEAQNVKMHYQLILRAWPKNNKWQWVAKILGIDIIPDNSCTQSD